MLWIKIVILIWFVPVAISQVTFLDEPLFRPYYRLMRHLILSIARRTSETPQYLRAARKLNRLQKYVSEDIPFPCDISFGRSAQRPKSVHNLRPGDIDVIGALGDSLTAGSGIAASELIHVFSENRGLSWSGGGQSTWREFLTLPNILKVFNPNLVGYATGDGLSIHKSSQFNVAETGAMSSDLPFMVRELARRMKNDKRVNFENDWKMITLFIGANDYCLDICYRKDPLKAPERRKKDLINVFRYIRDHIPRTFVNFLPTPDMEILLNFTSSPECLIYRTTECPCLYGPVFGPNARKYLRSITSNWRKVENDVVEMEEFKNSETFVVMLQPFIDHAIWPRNKMNQTDNTYLSNDCFHFSQKADARTANALWNNMLEPVGKKSTNWVDIFHPFLCPTESHPYLYTWKNS